MPELVKVVPSVVLAVYAHPDDAEVACGGALAAWSAGGSEVHVLVACGGDKGTTDPGAHPDELIERRRREMVEASAILGLASRVELGYPDGEIDETPSVREALVKEVRRLRPDIVVCPDPTAAFFGQEYVNHRDHRVVGWCAIDAVSPAAALPLYFPGGGPPHQVGEMYLSGTLSPDIAVDISSSLEQKVSALKCHRSQVGPSGEWVEALVLRRAEEAGHTAGVDYAETFRRLNLGA